MFLEFWISPFFFKIRKMRDRRFLEIEERLFEYGERFLEIGVPLIISGYETLGVVSLGKEIQ